MRICIALFLCAWLAGRLPVAAATDERVSGPNQGPYQMVGDPHKGRAVKLPRAAVRSVQQQIPGQPAHWIIYRSGRLPKQEPHLLLIYGEQQEYVALGLEPGRWVNFSAPGSVPSLNAGLERLRPADLQDAEKVEEYFQDVVFLRKYRLSVLMTPEEQQQHFRQTKLIDDMNLTTEERRYWLAKDPSLKEEQIDTWLGGPGSRQQLLALFHPLAVNRAGDEVTLSCNVIGPPGGVEQWTLHLRVERGALRLVGVDVRTIYPPGTFFFPLIS